MRFAQKINRKDLLENRCIIDRKSRQRTDRKPRKRDVKSMTVCVAALCDNSNTIVAISDAMVTMGNDIEVESFPKIIKLTRPIIAMLAKSVTLNADIINRMRETLGKYSKETMIPYEHKVIEIANLYRDKYLEIRKEKIEKEILTKYAINIEIWTEKGESLPPQVVDQILDDIKRFQMPNIEVIIAGIDESGGHIYVIDNDEIICYDTLGYACIGIGAEQAELEFINKKHTPTHPFTTTLLTAYFAKKNAEKVSGVGKATNFGFVVEEDSDVYRAGLFDNGDLLTRLTFIDLYKTICEINTNIKAKKFMDNFIESTQHKPIGEESGKKS